MSNVALIINYDIKRDRVRAFIEATRENADASMANDSALRFDLLQHPDDAHRFALVEVYASEADKKRHLASAHFKKWLLTTSEMHQTPPSLMRGSFLFGKDL